MIIHYLNINGCCDSVMLNGEKLYNSKSYYDKENI